MNAGNIGSCQIKAGGLDQFEFRDAVEIAGQGPDIAGAEFLRDEAAAGGGNIGQAPGLAKAGRDAFRRIDKRDSEDVDLLQVLLQRSREGQIPVGGGDDDVLRRGKLPASANRGWPKSCA